MDSQREDDLTRKFHINGSDRLEHLSRASADLWNRICTWYWRTARRQGHWLSKKAVLINGGELRALRQYQNRLKAKLNAKNFSP